MSAPKILLVEDEGSLAVEVLDLLEKAGYRVRWARDGREALSAPIDRYALVVVDLGLPDMDGLTVLSKLRERADVPVLVLTARVDPESRVKGLRLGADDYLTKPFWPEELVARVEARLRRPILAHESVVDLGELSIDLSARTASRSGAPLDLAPAEAAILVELGRRRGAAISRKRLIEVALDPEREATDRALDSHVSRLRKKLADAGELIETVRGIGYRLRAGGTRA